MFTANNTDPNTKSKVKLPFSIKWNGYDLFLSTVLSFATVLMTRVHYGGSVSGTAQENYFTDFGVSAIVLFFFLSVAFYLAVSFLDARLYRYLQRLCARKETDGDSSLKTWGIIIAIAWLPYYLSYYPGGIYSDTFNSISYCLTGTLCNRHPLFYNFLIDLAIKCGNLFGQDLEWSMGLFFGVQMILMGAELLFLLHWMNGHRIRRAVRTWVMAFMVFFPLIPIYASSVWKDTPFAMAFMFWFLFAVDLYLGMRRGDWRLQTFIGFLVGMFLVAFTRNNGIYVVAFVAIVFIPLTITCRLPFSKKLFTYGVLMLSVLMIAFIQGPGYRKMGVIPTDVVEDIGMPIQQICSVVVHDGNITDAQKESINRFIPYDNIQEYFKPCVVDSIKWYAGMDWGYLELHKGEFWDLWKHLFLQNPGIYIEEYLLETLGFWNVDVSGPNGYAETEVWSNDYGLVQTDYFERIFGFSFQHFVNPRCYISCAWFFWFFFVCMIFVMKHYGFWNCFLFMPQMAVWLTLMVATPIAISLRYVAPLLFTLPFVALVPILLEKEAPGANSPRE